MEWFLNDLSLCGQFASALEFRSCLEELLQLRQRRADLRSRVLCSQTFHQRPVTPTYTLQEAIIALGDPGFKKLALGWFANAGPFWDGSRMPNADDYFHFEGEDVTDQGLGEAARRQLANIAVGSYSFLNPPTNRFRRPALTVSHGLPEEPLGRQDIRNVWSIADVEAAVTPPGSWQEMFDAAKANLDMLIFSDRITEQLRPYPFYPGVADRVLDLLKVLQKIAQETRNDSALSAAGMELYQMHFTGGKAWFTDESEANKRDFRQEMTFTDPMNTTEKIFCPWHGKVKVGQYRIHFEWHRPRGQQAIKVMYIGPKITKR